MGSREEGEGADLGVKEVKNYKGLIGVNTDLVSCVC